MFLDMMLYILTEMNPLLVIATVATFIVLVAFVWHAMTASHADNDYVDPYDLMDDEEPENWFMNPANDMGFYHWHRYHDQDK
jgi:nitrogen fixation-related uncharacterized protein